MNPKSAASRFNPKILLLIGAVFALVMLLPLGCTTSTGGGKDCPAQDSLCLTKEQFLAKGDTLFQMNCTGCHGDSGQGGDTHAGHTPPLRNSNFFMAQRLRPVRILLLGLPNIYDTATEITVNGEAYINHMSSPMTESNNLDIAAVLSFVRDSLNGGGDLITVKEVATFRAAYPSPVQ